jgi:hypothetical protein
MRARTAITSMCFLFFAAAGSAFAAPVSFDFVFTGANSELGPAWVYTSTNGLATLTDYGFECSAPTAQSTSTLSSCALSNLYQSNNGVGLAGETDSFPGQPDHLIGYESSTQDFVEGMSLSDLYALGARSVTITFNDVEAWEAFAVLGYQANELNKFFIPGQIQLGANTKAWSEVDSATFDLNPQDEFLILISPCGASPNPKGPCDSFVAPVSLVASGATPESITPTPEPGTIALFATGLLMLGFAIRKRWATQRA